MSASDLLEVARAAGVQISADGDDLLLEAPTQPSAGLIDLLTFHKFAILDHLRPGKDGWSIADWQREFRTRAKTDPTRALAWSMATWLNRNPCNTPPGHCSSCAKSDCAQDPLLPYGIETAGVVWLHPRCWQSHASKRETEAAAALARMGIMHDSRPP